MNCQLVISVALLLALLSAECAAQDDSRATVPAPIPLAHKKPEELKLKHDSFTFVRLKYSQNNRRSSTWATDYPDSDIAFSTRLQKEVGLKTDPKGLVLELTDPKLKEYPFVYLVEGGSLRLSDAEADALRAYLEGGGFLMVDDFWGDAEWTNVALEFKKAFPKHKFVELSLKHPVFHSFYEIREKPQVPSVHVALTLRDKGVTWERDDAKEAHYRGLIDGKGRPMAIFCHNTDLGACPSQSERPRHVHRDSFDRLRPVSHPARRPHSDSPCCRLAHSSAEALSYPTARSANLGRETRRP